MSSSNFNLEHEGSPTTQKKVIRFSRDDYERILDWLEIEENFDTIYGAGQKTKVDEQCVTKLTKLTKLNELASILNIASNNRLGLTGQLLRHRMVNYRKMYQKTRTWLSRQIGAGLSQGEQQSSVRTLKELVERKCPFYERMERLFGNETNINPPILLGMATSSGAAEGSALDNASNEALELEQEFSHSVSPASCPSVSPSQPPTSPPPSTPHSLFSLPATHRLSRRQQRSSILVGNAGQDAGRTPRRILRMGTDLTSLVREKGEWEEKRKFESFMTREVDKRARIETREVEKRARIHSYLRIIEDMKLKRTNVLGELIRGGASQEVLETTAANFERFFRNEDNLS